MKNKFKFFIIILFILLILGQVYLVMFGVFNNEDLKRDTTNISDYGDWYGLLTKSNLAIFPKEILISAYDVEFSYFNDDHFLGESTLLSLRCSYNEEDFKKEINRLESIKGINVDNKNYNYKAYVALLFSYYSEYALIINENTILYLCINDGYKSKDIDDIYLRNNEAVFKEMFSIYDDQELIYWPKSYQTNNLFDWFKKH